MKQTITKILSFFILLTFFVGCARGQTKTDKIPSTTVQKTIKEAAIVKAPEYIYDTSRVICTYIADSTTAQTKTGYCTRIIRFHYQFVTPTQQQLTSSDSVMLHKKYVFNDVVYYVPFINANGKTIQVPIPQDYVLFDFNTQTPLKLSEDPFKKYR